MALVIFVDPFSLHTVILSDSGTRLRARKSKCLNVVGENFSPYFKKW